MQDSYRKAGCFSALFQLKLLCKVYRENELRSEDLLHLPIEQDTRNLVAKLGREWNHESKKRNPSLLRALCRVFGLKFAGYSLLTLDSLSFYAMV